MSAKVHKIIIERSHFFDYGLLEIAIVFPLILMKNRDRADDSESIVLY
ncbi:MAG: hypothetical protein AAGA60_04545 [Cyanobacteria bacterium P01_E01_bin.42]